MRRSRTAWASGRSSGISKTSACAISIPTRIAISPSAWRRSAPSARPRSTKSSELCATNSSGSGIDADVTGRPKHFYSIYTKLKKGRDFSTIYDLTAVRIIVDTVKDCYASLGAVHSLWKPLPGRFKDYIAMPKPNMYQSLHTTVVGPGGDPLEVQIRTLEMHRTSEYGIAAHWRYKEGGKADAFENKLTWLRSLLEWQNDMRDSRVFMENLKLDLFENAGLHFFAQGRRLLAARRRDAARLRLPGAYRRRQSLRRREGQRQDRPARLSAKNGDICEMLTNKSARPSLDWLSLVKTSGAKHKIKQWFRKERKTRTSSPARSRSKRELARAALAPRPRARRTLEKIAKRMNYTSADRSLRRHRLRRRLGSLGRARVQRRTQDDEYRRFHDVAARPAPPRAALARNSSGIRIAGVDDVLVRLSKCCSPVPAIRSWAM